VGDASATASMAARESDSNLSMAGFTCAAAMRSNGTSSSISSSGFSMAKQRSTSAKLDGDLAVGDGVKNCGAGDDLGATSATDDRVPAWPDSGRHLDFGRGVAVCTKT